MTEIKLYNSKTRSKSIFSPLDPKNVRMYVCGPTVYDRAHIGNARPVIIFDILFRLLRYKYGERYVNYARNFTDVDDKINASALRTGRTIREITNETIKWFISDMQALGNLEPSYSPRATEYIEQMISMNMELLNKGYAYEAENHLIFEVHKYKNYGSLSGRSIDDMIAGARVEVAPYKKNPMDFILWKPSEANEPGWNSPWGYGRPGWHIECSAMSSESLGDHFDIHCGGVDNMFPHHENEIAQSQCATDQPFVNYWLHSEFLMVDGGKMSKSLGNFYQISALKELGFSAESIRYQLLAGHYRSKITFSINKKHEGDKVVQRLSDFYNRLQKMNAKENSTGSMPEVYSKFRDRMNDDLDSPQALAIFFDWMKTVNGKIDKNVITDSDLGEAWEFLVAFDSVFGFIQNQDFEIPDNINLMLNKRQKARDEENWVESDLIREHLKEKGWMVEDTPDGQYIKKA